MTTPNGFGFSLGSWSGMRLRIHPLLIAFAICQLGLGLTVLQRSSGLGPLASFSAVGLNLCLLLIVLLTHEAAHILIARRLGVETGDISLGPLGDLSRPSGDASRSSERVAIACAGPLANLVCFLICAIILWTNRVDYPFWGPLVRAKSPVPTLEAFTWLWAVGWFGSLNFLVAAVNLMVPALPMDSGRILRSRLAAKLPSGRADSHIFELWLARSLAAILVLVAAFRVLFRGFDDPAAPSYLVSLHLVALAMTMEWMVRTEPRMVEDDGFFEDGVFDEETLRTESFSSGYNAHEDIPTQVRPRPDSALKRWRKRRSEVRKLRSEARAAADSQRLDEILEKISREGKTALTGDEHRFLNQMSLRLRKSRSTSRAVGS